MPNLEMTAGSGSFAVDGLISYSYSEDATPSNPQNLNGGSGQVNATVEAVDGPLGTRLTIGNQALLTDEDYGNLSFTVKQVSINEGVASVVGATVQDKLNVDRTALPQGSNGSGYTLYEAILYYCSLVGVTPLFETGVAAELDAIDIDFIGWQGNVWEYLKMLCAGFPVGASNKLLEMYFKDSDLWFRFGLTNSLDWSEYQSEDSISIETFDAAQEFIIYNYNTSYRANSLIRQQDAGYGPYAGNEYVSITDSLQVNAGETLVKRISINASLELVNQPRAVYSITSIPYTGTTGEYVILGNDNLPVQPAQWEAEGGRLSVALTENPNEIEVTLVGPTNAALAPYRIGAESSGNVEYPAFYVTGTGVFFDKQAYTIRTGAAATATTTSTTIDNPFITNLNHMYTRGLAAAQEICGPKYTIKKDLATGPAFGSAIGSMITDYDNKFRVTGVNFDPNGVSVTGSSYVTFADFNSSWSGRTFANFNTQMADINFTEFAVIPFYRSA